MEYDEYQMKEVEDAIRALRIAIGRSVKMKAYFKRRIRRCILDLLLMI